MNTFTAQSPFGPAGPVGLNTFESAAQPPQPAEPQPTITLDDIRMASHIIDLATTRGAFRASELAAIGNCWDRINKFLQGADAATKEQQGAQNV
jgi:hypothetical protein